MIKIAIDGFSGSGKGELAEGIAKKLNLKHLDTGAIFRAIAIAFIEANIETPTEEIAEEFVKNINVKVEFDENKQKVILNDKDITPGLRQEAVSKMSSKVSALKPVREKYLKVVKDFANNYDCIIDGRDITSIVLPDADVKIFLDADEKVRAERRYKENVEKNIKCTYEEVLANLQERDYRDSHRDIAPLIIVEDAVVVDNSNMSIQETIDYCLKIINEKLKANNKL